MENSNLLLSKFLFIKGKESVDLNNSMSCGLAISLFQDAVEMLLWAIVKTNNTNPKETFMGLWESLEKSGIILPFKAKMLELNKARVGFKHYGNLPDPQEAVKYCIYTEEFLIESMSSILQINFNELSISDLITNENVKKKIKAAELEFEQDNYHNCVTLCGEAEALALKPLYDLFPSCKLDTSRVINVCDKDDRKADILKKIFSGIESSVNNQRTLLLMSLTNMDIYNFVKFKSIMPHTQMTAGGTFYYRYDKTDFTKDDAKYCLVQVIRIALALQDKIFKNTQNDMQSMIKTIRSIRTAF